MDDGNKALFSLHLIPSLAYVKLRHLANLQSPKTSPKVSFSLQAGHIRTTPQPLSWLCRGPSLPAVPSLRPGGPVSVAAEIS